ncbi:DNA cytosine methyltransferase [Devosia ginsengisoli]|uniref:DNA cytosine methyltransferase n=1 Tax=Devosia ginsengisoli TaxID=400770 RepID=UPI0026F1E214|nr:DNA cytosine methyltransferase [Devosia ginsengisoli]MCR6673262.1 DNA cytosine methyltransferase [Devosia ginsengisoli]
MTAMLPASGSIVEFTHFQLFCGLGGTAKGFNRGKSRVGGFEGRFRCVGGIDVDPASIRDFSRMAGVQGTVLDLFSLEQYTAFHGHEPPADWRQAMPEDVRAAAHGEFPDVVFLSAPCKGFSGLLGEAQSKTAKYQALNELTLRGVWLMLEAFKDDPPGLIGFENVPRIAKRGRHLLDQIIALLRSYGYEVSETTHDCGVLGGLGQSRKRFLLVARHRQKVPPFLWEPPKRRLRGVGEILEKLPLPGDPRGGVMHRMPALQWKTWVRLAFVEAGSDWRSLNKLQVADGVLSDFGIMPERQWQAGVLGVQNWDEPSGVVAGRNGPTNGNFAVADPRFEGLDYKQYGVRKWAQTTGAVINVKAPGQGGFSVADPRLEGKVFNNIFRIVPWEKPANAVAGPGGAGGPAVADPRPAQREDYTQVKYRVTSMDEASGAVIAASTTGTGAFAVADPRPLALNADHREGYETGGHYGVVPWKDTSRAVPGFAKNNNGPWSVADPRHAEGDPVIELPKASDRLVAVIRALDGTWHRPFTTLELAALQSLVDPDEIWTPDPLIAKLGDMTAGTGSGFTLDGSSDSAWRERIGNAVPPDAAEAIASVMGTTLLLAMTGQTFMLSSEPIWVQPLAVALSIDHSPNDGMLD